MSFEVRCNGCGQLLPVGDINLDRMLARCTQCNLLFDCSDQLPGAAPSRVEPAPRERPERPRPSSIQVLPRGHQLIMLRRWFGFHLLFLLFFCIAWDSFLVFWYGAVLSSDNIPWIAIVFPLGHVAVGVGLTYYVLAGFLNKTEIRVDSNSFSVRHFPLPWPGAVSLNTYDLDQLFTVQNIGSKGSRSYEVCALLKDGRRVKLMSNLSSGDEAVFIEQQVEKHLNIEDVAVDGEYGRR